MFCDRMVGTRAVVDLALEEFGTEYIAIDVGNRRLRREQSSNGTCTAAVPRARFLFLNGTPSLHR